MFRLHFFFYMTVLPMCRTISEEWQEVAPLSVDATFASISSLVVPTIFLKLVNLAIGHPLLWGTEAAGMMYRKDMVDNISAISYNSSNTSRLNLQYLLINLFKQAPYAGRILNPRLTHDSWSWKLEFSEREEIMLGYLQTPILYLVAPTYIHTGSTLTLNSIALEDIYFNLTMLRILNNIAYKKLEDVQAYCAGLQNFLLNTYFLAGFVGIFFANLVFFLLLTLIIATITLMERKLLALVQRRVGPNYIGYRGRFQFIADAIKLLVKHIIILPAGSRLLFLVVPPMVLVLCYLFWVNLVWGPSLALCEIEYNLLFMAILSLIFSYLLFIVGWVSKNKYAILSSNRVIVAVLNLEILLNFMLLILLLCFESFSFLQIVSFQAYRLWTIFICLPVLPLIIITFLLETGRIPFDLGEAESELIAGYTTEMGGFFFALFYLGEYFHLFCFAVIYVLCFFGGWL